MKWIVGVDEAGRGPLAGPVAVGVAAVPTDFDWELIPGVGDSKKITAKNREIVFKRAYELRRDKVIDFRVSLINVSVIDTKGITHAVRIGIQKCFTSLDLNPDQCDVRLDGLLKAPEEFLTQATIIKGDAKEKSIGLASILAKVTRDQHMERLSLKHPEYQFDTHKGYGTKSHRELILQHGLSSEHRASFCRNLQK